MTTESAVAEETIRSLVASLRALAHTPAPCFCQHGLGHPLVTSHTKTCDSVRVALLSAELTLRQWYPEEAE